MSRVNLTFGGGGDIFADAPESENEAAPRPAILIDCVTFDEQLKLLAILTRVGIDARPTEV